MTKILLAATVSLGLGCGYLQGSVTYSENPDLRDVRLFTGQVDPEGENLGAVELQRSSSGSDCTRLGSEAMRDLLREARALGGTAVKNVKFRGRYNWMGRVVCRRSMSGISVQIRGTATR